MPSDPRDEARRRLLTPISDEEWTVADLDLDALRIRLAELPGFDATGLVLRDNKGDQEGIVVYDDGRDVLVHPEDGDSEPAYWTKDQDNKPYTHGDEEPHVSAADAATRDRLARWCAERLYPGEHYIAAAVTPGRSAAPWLSKPMYGLVTVTWDNGWRWRALLDRHEEPMVTLDVSDPRLLPDGSRYVDALALVAVARHLGGQP